YHCAQLAKRQHKPVKSELQSSQRDKGQMDSFDCDGWLFMTISEIESYAQVQLKHAYDHVVYSEMQVPPDVQEYVENNFKMSTTCSLYQRVLSSFQIFRHWETRELLTGHVITSSGAGILFFINKSDVLALPSPPTSSFPLIDSPLPPKCPLSFSSLAGGYAQLTC
ncbi:hypothetical protein K435DRAFT_693221, partial [Dendrothele bispora CBS 962.96]